VLETLHYYLSPEKVGVDLFVLLFKTMIDTGKVEMGKIVTGSKESLMEKNGVTWVDPSLQIEVNYFEDTEVGHFRFLVF